MLSHVRSYFQCCCCFFSTRFLRRKTPFQTYRNWSKYTIRIRIKCKSFLLFTIDRSCFFSLFQSLCLICTAVDAVAFINTRKKVWFLFELISRIGVSLSLCVCVSTSWEFPMYHLRIDLRWIKIQPLLNWLCQLGRYPLPINWKWANHLVAIRAPWRQSEMQAYCWALTFYHHSIHKGENQFSRCFFFSLSFLSHSFSLLCNRQN